MSRPLRVYIAGPYSNPDEAKRDRNIEMAAQHAALLLKAGHYPFCPHTMTARFEDEHPEVDYPFYLRMYCHWMKFCDAVYVLPGWQSSNGTAIELRLAEELRMPIYFDASFVPTVDGYPSMAELTELKQS